MSWQDRDYKHADEGRGGAFAVLNRLLGWSLPLGTWFGIPIRMHATLVIMIGWTVLLDPLFTQYWPYLFALQNAATAMAVLFGIVLLHEFGHCVAARAVGGSAYEIMLWPLGGLAMVDTPARPWPTFVAAAGGPFVNVLICVVAGLGLYAITGSWATVPINPFRPTLSVLTAGGIAYYLWWFFLVSYAIFLFNLLPVYPLDGGRILQTVLWKFMGRYRSEMVAAITGMIGCGVLGLVGLLSGNLWLTIIASWLLLGGWQLYRHLKEVGPYGYEEMIGYQRAQHAESTHRKHHLSRRMIKRARRLAAEEQAEQERIDQILAKVSAHGMHSLTWLERRALHKATERQRERDLEVARGREA